MSYSIDKSEFDAWFKHPCTELLFRLVRDRKELMEQQIIDLALGTSLENFYNIKFLRGTLSMCDCILNVSFENIGEVENE